jgi:hypothetical protein
LEFNQILSGLVEKLGADKHAINLDRVLRLPGTYNIKGVEPIECCIESILTDKLYVLDDFKHLINIKFEEVEFDINSIPDFGRKEQAISSESYEAAKADIDKLEIKSQAKNMILSSNFLLIFNLLTGKWDNVGCEKDLSDYFQYQFDGFEKIYTRNK